MAEQTAMALLQSPDSKPLSRTWLDRRAQWTVWSERFLLLALILLFALKAFIPAWKHLNTDFPNYYLGARLYRQGYPIERVYEWTWFQREKDHLGVDQRLVGFIPLTLPSILPVMPWALLPPLQAKHAWLLMNLLFLVLIAALLKTSARLNIQRITLLMLLAVIPLRHNFLFGQMHILVLILLTLSAWLYFRDLFFSSGVILAVAAALKIYPALFLILFLFRKQWRAAAGLISGLLSTVLMSLYLFGRDACQLYAFEVLPRALRGEVTDPYNVAWNSFTSLLRRLFLSEPELNPAPLAHWPIVYAFLQPAVHAVIVVAFFWVIGSKTDDRERIKLEWVSYSFLLLLLSSQPASYHFVAMILTVVIVVDCLLARGEVKRAGIMAALYILICGPLVHISWIQATGWRNLLFYPRLALMVLFGGMLLWVLMDVSPSIANRGSARRTLSCAVALVALVTVGFVSNLRHLKGQFDNYQARVITVPGSAIATDPVVTSEGLFYTALVPQFPSVSPNTYAVHKLTTGSVTVFAGGNDWFHPAMGRDVRSMWAEVATGGGSRVVIFTSSLSLASTNEPLVEVKDGQEPVASLDGKMLAFIRQVKGHNSLWVREPSGEPASTEPVREHQVVGPQYDVRDVAFFQDHRIALTAKREGRFRLYVVDPSSDTVEEMSVPICSARYPAISPDGQWIAFSCLERGTWQVQMMNLRTQKPIQLTNADCNSIAAVWTLDAKELFYATDCGRGLGLTALAKLNVSR